MNGMNFLYFLVIGICLTASIPSAAFPEMIRHGYVSCTACHVSPSGGGVLTPYGRELSRELMSTWGREHESKFLYGWLEKKEPGNAEAEEPGPLRLGGDIRAVQTFRENSQFRRGNFIAMQADLELGVDDGKYAAIVGVGLQPSNRAGKDLNQFFSRKHYFLVRLTDEKSIRVGKFLKSFGLNLADHYISVRRDLRWDFGMERYNLEYADLGEKVSTFLTLISDDPEEASVEREYGVSAVRSWTFSDISKFGFSYFYGRGSSGSRDVFGPFWIWSLNPHFFWMTELDWQLKNPTNSERTSGYAVFSRVGYEVHKGVIPFIQFDRSHLDTDDPNIWWESQGIGLQWFPRPHWELLGSANRELRANSEPTNFIWFLMHYYF